MKLQDFVNRCEEDDPYLMALRDVGALDNLDVSRFDPSFLYASHGRSVLDFHFDDQRKRVAWDATAPIPSNEGKLPVRRWPGVTLHDPEVLSRVDSWLEDGGF